MIKVYNVLIVDDENLIRRGIRNIIDWESHGFTICGEAVNGKDAIEKAYKLNPDLIIVDVKMPVIDGLQMIEQLIANGYNGRFIILSGYSEFNYAQKAIELGVDAYLLKPINETELIKKLAVEYKRISDSKNNAPYFSSLSGKNESITKFINGKASESDIYIMNNIYKFHLPWQSYQLAVICFNSQEIDYEKKYPVFINETKFMKDIFEFHTFYTDKELGILIKDFDISKKTYCIDIIYSNLCAKMSIQPIIAIGVAVIEPQKLGQSFKSLQKILSAKEFYCLQKIVYETPYMGVDDHYDTNEWANKLFNAITLNNKDYIINTIEEMCDLFCSNYYSENNVKRFCSNLYSSITNRLIESKYEIVNALSSCKNMIEDIYNCNNIIFLKRLISEKLVYICDSLFDGDSNDIINKIENYINSNYSSNITLETISHIFNYNSVYLGKLFRERTGEYFNTYVDMVRVRKACELLDKGLKVYEVSKKVGYTDNDYFSSKFKKYTGMSPSQYKKSKESKYQQ